MTCDFTSFSTVFQSYHRTLAVIDKNKVNEQRRNMQKVICRNVFNTALSDILLIWILIF